MDIADFSLDLFALAGRNALVTGGNTGLGRAFSVALAKAGADVFAVGLAEDDGTTRRLIEGAGRRMEFVMADITQPGVPAAVVHRCVETLGSVDILVNSAGIALLSDVEEFGRDLWDPMVAVRLTATMGSHRSRPNSSTSDSSAMPAELTKMSTEPRVSTQRCTTAAGTPGCVMSAITNSIRRPAPSISRRVVPSSSARPTANTSAPALARATEKARPRPVLPPVTRALRPATANRSRLKPVMSMTQRYH